MEKYLYKLEMKVRDYECDLQGVVNNANYQHYLEHARHEFLEAVGGSFATMHEQGIDPLVAKITLEYKRPLRSGDRFEVCINIERKGVKLIFYQDIYNIADGTLAAKGIVYIVCLKDGHLTRGEYFDELLSRCTDAYKEG
jgi:acyl-CoA thioester hydrolase